MKSQTKSGVLTSYLVGSVKYSTYVTGKSIDEVNSKILQRGLGEIIESSLMEVETIPDYKDLTPVEFLANLPQITHTACFLALIAIKSKSISIDEVLGDDGILHELIHINSKSIPVSESVIEEVKLGFTFLRDRAVGIC